MPSWNTQRFFLPSIERHVALPGAGRVLDMGYDDPAAALWAARRVRHVLALRAAIDLVAGLDQQARHGELDNVEARLALQPQQTELGTFDATLLLAPFFLGNAAVRDSLQTAAAALKPDGALYIQLHRRHGGDTYLRYVEGVFDRVAMLDMGGGQRRLYRATGARPGALLAPSAPPLEAPLHEVLRRGIPLQLRLAAGVFGARGVDAGSRLLLETIDVPPRAAILDLGCGAGTIGLALAAADPSARLVLVDVSLAAVELARSNATLNHLRNVDARIGDGYAAVPQERFDVIVSNPPAHRQHEADATVAERFITDAATHLRAGGEAWFVANRALPYESMATRAFRQVRLAAADNRYKVIHCTEPRPELEPRPSRRPRRRTMRAAARRPFQASSF